MASQDRELNRPSEVIYQIYPSTFHDSNGDGTGDIKGIAQKLDYIKSLNVDAIWINPITLSPEGAKGDGGYAKSNGTEIAPQFGSMKDFLSLLSAAHAKDLRVYMDFVPCHTADDHDWFKASHDPSHPEHEKYKDYYIWHDGKRNESGELIKVDGKPMPPNNWCSVFGGSAWSCDDKRGQFYLHHFNDSQPSLNLNDEKVQAAVLNEMKFWLDKGVDGFRVDALPFANYDPQFRDNPKRNVDWNNGDWQNHWSCQDFDHSMCQPQTVEFVAKIRKLMDSYPPEQRKTALGEVVAGAWGGNGSIEQAAGHTNPKTGERVQGYLSPETGLDSCYTQSFVDFWYTYPPADRLRDMISKSVQLSPDGGLGDALDNHDFPRFATRLTHGVPTPYHDTIVKQLLTLWASLPGSKYLYNGDELGLTQAQAGDIPADKIKDPAIEKREPCRTPMPWNATSRNAGFSVSGDPVLPIPESHLPLAVNVQDNQAESTLNITRRLLQQRHGSIALARGKTVILDARFQGDPVVAFLRKTEGQAVLCTFNMSQEKAHVKIADYPLDAKTIGQLHMDPEAEITMRPYGNAHYGLPKGIEGKVEVGMGPPSTLGFPVKNGGYANGVHPAKTIFATDMLIADNHIGEGHVVNALPRLMKNNPAVQIGGKAMIEESEHKALTLDAVKHLPAGLQITPGGSTSCMVRTLKEMLKDDVNINLMGWAADDPHGKIIKSFLKDSGIHLLTEEWPEGVGPQTAVSHVIAHADGAHTILTYPGTEIEALHKALAQQSTADLVEKNIRESNIVYMTESTLSKYGLPFARKLLESRWRNKKELVLSLPNSASFGPSDSDSFREWIPSANIVMGNDVEFCRIMTGKETKKEVSDEQMDKTVKGLQAAFKRQVLQENNMPCSRQGQVALITRGRNKPSLLVTKDNVIAIEPDKNTEIKNVLGAANAAFAGFLGGYIKGYDHETSARIAMNVAAEKVSQDGIAPFIREPERIEEYLGKDVAANQTWQHYAIRRGAGAGLPALGG